MFRLAKTFLKPGLEFPRKRKNAMAFVPAEDVVAVEVVYELDGQTVENTLYYHFEAGSPTLTDVRDLLGVVRDVIVEELIPLLSNAITLVRLIGTLLTTADALSTVLAVSPPVAGGAVEEPVPSNVAYSVQLKTASRGRSFRGRNYIAGLPGSQVVLNTVSVAERANIVAAYEVLRVAGDATWTLGVLSRQHNNVPRVTAVFSPVTSVDTADATVDSQRRRLPGRGR